MIFLSDRTISYNFRGNFTNLTAGLTAAGRGVQDFGGRLTALDAQGARMRAGLTTVGNAAGKIGLVAAAGLGAVIAVTAKFESAMSRVSAATNASAGDLEKLRNAAIKAGADTVFSASEAADGITELGKAGLSTSDILSGGLTGALDLAAAGQISVADAAATTAITLSQFSLAGSQASRVADVLAAGAGKALGSVGDMSEALKYVGPVASQMGLSLEDAAGGIAELASQGILGSQAGTSLRGILTSLTSPSKLAANTMTGLGISVYDAQGKFIGLDGVAGQLQSTLGGLTEAQRNEALGRIFGNEQITAARVLYAGGAADVQKWTAQVTDSGYAAEQAAKLTDNLAGDIEQLKGSFETALIGTGSSSQGPLRGMVQNLTDIVNGYSALPGPAKTATGAALGLTAALGGGVFVFSKAISGLAGMQTFLVSMGVSAERAATSTKLLGRVGVGAAGLGLLAAGLASTNKAMAALSTTAGGAAIGFSVGGPWGAAVGGAIGLVVGLGKSHDDTAKKVATLSSSFDTQTGAITANTAAMVAKQLQDDGLLDTAEQFGVSTQTVTDAVLGQAAAQAQLKAALDATGYATTQTSLEDLRKSFGDVAGEQIYAQQQAYALREGVEEQTGTFQTSAEKAKQLAEAMNGTGTATAAAGTAAYRTAEEVDAAAKVQEQAAKAANDTAVAFFNLGDSLNDSKVSLGDWIADLEKQANALRDFRVNAQKAADQGLRKGLIAALQEAGPEGAMRLGQLANASEAEIGRANRAWKRGQGQINAYTDAVGNVPASATTVVVVRDETAYAKIAAIKRELATIPDENVNVNVRRVNAGGMGPQAVSTNAAGGYIRGPGSATSDSIPARLSDGEYVIKAASVAKYGVAMFDGLNAQRFASGGEVTGDKATSDSLRGRSGVLLPGVMDVSGGLKATLRDLERSFKSSTKAVDAQTNAVDAATQAYEDTKSQYDSLASSVSGQFQSDLFSVSGNPFGDGSGSDPISILMSDIANSTQFQSLFSGLQAAGLSGGALTAAAQGGTSALQTLSNYSPTQLAQYSSLYGQREQMAGISGQQAGLAQYGAALQSQAADMARQTAQNDQLIAENRELKKAINQVKNAIDRKSDRDDKSRKDAADRTGDKVNGGAQKGKQDKHKVVVRALGVNR